MRNEDLEKITLLRTSFKENIPSLLNKSDFSFYYYLKDKSFKIKSLQARLKLYKDTIEFKEDNISNKDLLRRIKKNRSNLIYTFIFFNESSMLYIDTDEFIDEIYDFKEVDMDTSIFKYEYQKWKKSQIDNDGNGSN